MLDSFESHKIESRVGSYYLKMQIYNFYLFLKQHMQRVLENAMIALHVECYVLILQKFKS